MYNNSSSIAVKLVNMYKCGLSNNKQQRVRFWILGSKWVKTDKSPAAVRCHEHHSPGTGETEAARGRVNAFDNLQK